MSDTPKSEPPKKHIVTGIDISNLSRVRPTRIPSASVGEEVRQQKTSYRRLAIDAGILCLIILIAYGVSLIGDFVYNDHYIVNFLANKISEESFWSNFIVRAISQPLSQPWIMASFVFDLKNFGYDHVWYHVVNIVLHLFSCFYFYLLVYVLARYFWQNDGREQPVHEIALCAAALLACHPLCSEGVAHISGRTATLTACNIFLTLNFFLLAFLSNKMKNVFRGYILTFIFLLQAILCGVQALALPACMLLLAFLLKPASISTVNWFKEKWGETVVIVLLVVLMPLIAMPGFTADYSNGIALPLQSWQVYVASQFQSLVSYYLRCFLLPVGLSIFPPFTTASNLTDPLAIIGFLVLGLGIYSIYRFRNKPLTAFGLGLAVLSYLPPMFFVQNEIAADWRFYIPIAGLSLVLASVLKPWLLSWRTSVKARAFILFIVALLITGSIFRTLDFHSETRLFKTAVRVNQSDVWAKGMLSLALVNGRRGDKGIVLARQVIAINKACQPAHLALGEALIPTKKNKPEAMNQYRLAKDELEQALSLAKSQHLGILILFNTERALASVLIELNEYKRTKEIAEQALLVNPNSNSLNIIMGRSLNGLGEYVGALPYLNKAYELDHTNPDFVEPMAECALRIGTPSFINVAYNISRMGVKVCQTHNLQLIMAQSALATGQLNEAVQWSELAWKQRPNEAKALYLRSFVLKAAGHHKLAQISKDRALMIDPNIAKKMPIVVLKKDRSVIIPFEELYPLARGQ